MRDGELTAFVELPADLLTADPGSAPSVAYYAEDTAFSDVRRWVRTTLNELIRARRLQAVGIDPQVVAQASRSVDVKGVDLGR